MSVSVSTMVGMSGKIWIEAWSPEYGASFDAGSLGEGTDENVDPYVETTDWAPVTPPPSALPPAVFVDGVGRVDARAIVEDDGVMGFGLCVSVGAGSVIADSTAAGKAKFGQSEVKRAAIFASGFAGSFPPMPAATAYEARSVKGPAADDLLQELQSIRSELELKISRELGAQGYLVFADGPLLARREATDMVGLIKSHRKSYLEPDLEPVVRLLRAGQRTPLFHFGIIRPRYSWYLRLAEAADEHPWAGIMRCEASSSLSLQRAVALAELTAYHLPRFASKAFWDTRAPQNLVPIATLERRLWHLMGDRQMVYRSIRSALRSNGQA